MKQFDGKDSLKHKKFHSYQYIFRGHATQQQAGTAQILCMYCMSRTHTAKGMLYIVRNIQHIAEVTQTWRHMLGRLIADKGGT